MHQEQRDQAHQRLKTAGLNRAMFANPANVTGLTGLERPWQAGADLYSGIPPLVWYEDRTFIQIVVDNLASQTTEYSQQTNYSISSYRGYSFEKQPNGDLNQRSESQLLLQALQILASKMVVILPGRTSSWMVAGRFGK